MGVIDRKPVDKMNMEALKAAMAHLGLHSNYTLLTAEGTEGDACRLLEDPNLPACIAVVGREEVEPGTWLLLAGGKKVWFDRNGPHTPS